MSSLLYNAAQGLLADPEKQHLTEFQTWLASVNTPDLDGARLRANIEGESHLVGTGAFGTPQELAAFLEVCAGAHAKATSDYQKRLGYTNTCTAFELKGLSIDQANLPAGFLRYSVSRTLVAILVDRMLGRTARRDFDSGLMSVEDAFNRLTLYWSAARLTDAEKLARASAVFATFDHDGNAPREDARALADALALPVLLRVGGGEEILFEFFYKRDAVQGCRFPTVADAGLFHLFQPAPELAPDPANRQTLWGWTRPVGGQEAQPEIVHENASLRVVDGAPRLVGRMTI
jgi:hypothetical protein